MIYKIEELNKKVNEVYFVSSEPKAQNYNNYVDLFTEKFVLLEEMVLVMLDKPEEQKIAIEALLKAYREIRIGLYVDLKQKINQEQMVIIDGK